MTVKQKVTLTFFFSNRSLRYGLSDTQFSSRYIANILDYVLSKDIGHRIAWEFVTENWSFLSERYGNQPVMIYFCVSFAAGANFPSRDNIVCNDWCGFLSTETTVIIRA